MSLFTPTLGVKNEVGDCADELEECWGEGEVLFRPRITCCTSPFSREGRSLNFPSSSRKIYRSSLSPFATILRRSAGNGSWSFNASSGSADSHASNSSTAVNITGIALAWIGRTTSLDSVV